MSGESGCATRQIYGQSVRPEPVSQKSFYENVAGFINEVILQSNTTTSQFEGKEQITWVRFEQCDINDLSQFKDKIERNGNAPPFLILIGYVNGVQGWAIPATGEAIEVFSWRQGAVKMLKVLTTPTTSERCLDKYSLKRPIVAICDTAGMIPTFNSVSFISLLTGEQLKTIKFKSQVQDIYANKTVVVISFMEKLAVFEATTFEDMFTISTCYKSPGPSVNPIALGDQWLAFADRKLYSIHQSCGGVVTEGTSSYKSTVFQAAQNITRGIKEIGETFATNIMGTQKASIQQQQSSPIPSTVPGCVTIVDIQRVISGRIDLGNSECKGIVAHFTAHQGAPVVALEFDSSGMILATADSLAHNFHVFRIQPHPLASSQAAIHHLYTLYRGDTTAQVMALAFSLDSRWLAVATHRGTTHVFPITPYGGTVCWRTHKALFVVNKLSRFQRSAGLDDSPSSGRNSPVSSVSPGVAKLSFESSPNVAYHNPFYPPYPVPSIIKPLVQLRQPLFQHLLESIVQGPSPTDSPPSKSKVSVTDTIVKVALTFGSSRGWLAGSPTVPRESKRHLMDSLYVMAYHGCLIEYHLTPKVATNIPQDKVTDYSPLELEVAALAQWPLARETMNHQVKYPLHPENPLLISLDAQLRKSNSPSQVFEQDDPEERWMAQVEINTHIGPSRRLWMGPQFYFKSVPSSGVLEGGEDPSESEISDPSLEFPPRSSPVNMPGIRGAPVHIEAGPTSSGGSLSPKFGDRLSGEYEVVEGERGMAMSKLRHDLADAMQDQPNSGKFACISPKMVDDSCFDLSEVMDISCDPPGSCSSGSHGCTSNRHEDQLQAVTAKLHQVAITSHGGDHLDMSPFRGARTPSLEECRALTSSAEELASTLEQAKLNDSHPAYVLTPIEPLNHSPVSSPVLYSSSLRFGRQRDEDSSPVFSVWGRRAEEIKCVEEDLLKTSWSSVVVESKPLLIPANSEKFPPLGGNTSNGTSGRGGGSKSTTTSEDDLWTSKETKKDRKRRRKRNKGEDSEDLLRAEGTPRVSPPPPPPTSNFSILDSSTSLPIDPEYFVTAEEFHDSLDDDPGRGHMTLHSVHEGDDLARALEEASSDESLPVRTKKDCGHPSTKVVDEMFPFRETSSDEDDDAASRLRRRNVKVSSSFSGVPSSFSGGAGIYDDDEDDDRETSGDDRKNTSESDATASPNPRSSAAAKGKRKKKKRK